jgi:hypothetical protein
LAKTDKKIIIFVHYAAFSGREMSTRKVGEAFSGREMSTRKVGQDFSGRKMSTRKVGQAFPDREKLGQLSD